MSIAQQLDMVKARVIALENAGGKLYTVVQMKNGTLASITHFTNFHHALEVFSTLARDRTQHLDFDLITEAQTTLKLAGDHAYTVQLVVKEIGV